MAKFALIRESDVSTDGSGGFFIDSTVVFIDSTADTRVEEHVPTPTGGGFVATPRATVRNAIKAFATASYGWAAIPNGNIYFPDLTTELL